MEHRMPLLENELTISPYARFLKKHGLYSAAHYYLDLNETLERRAARAGRFVLENLELPDFEEGQSVPIRCNWNLFRPVEWDDPKGWGLRFHMDGDALFDEPAFRRLDDEARNTAEHHIADLVRRNGIAMFGTVNQVRYDHGGTHNVVDFDFVLNEGLGAYREKAEKERLSPEPEHRMFAEAMLDMLEGTEHFLRRYREKLAGTPGAERLAAALARVPMEPARSFYEAWVSCGMAMALSGCFEPGRIDQYLWPFYERDLAAGITSEAEAYALLRATFEDIDRGIGHPGVTHVTVGGTDKDGKNACNALTEQCILGIRGLRTPNVTLRVRKDMPRKLWDLYLENTAMGCGQPAIVNEELFLEKLTTDYAIPFTDAVDYVFGGCSELLIQGRTMCDSTWVQYNMLDVFEHTLYRHFLSCDTFEAFYEKYLEAVAVTVRDMGRQINLRQEAMGNNQPMLMRSLMTRGCLEAGRSFTAGGAPYNFDSTNIYASSNAINSLYTLKYFYDGKLGDLTREQLLTALIRDFEGCGEVLAKCKAVPKFGNHDPELNALAHDLMSFTFDRVMELRCWRGNGRYMPAIILWIDWISSGLRVGATPDGRRLGEATADSCGPMQGTDTEGPTSVMNAALSLEQGKCAGTCVLNLRLDSANFRSPERREKVLQLIRVYLARGGSQLQINVLDSKRLRAALADPQNHRDIIVRVGGFSDNFVLLDEKIQKEVLRRTEHSV